MTGPNPSAPEPATTGRAERLWEMFPKGMLVFERPATEAAPARLLASRLDFCTAPDCDCRDVMLVGVPLDPAELPSSEGFGARFNGPEAMHGYINVDSGHVEGDGREDRTPLTADWITHLSSAIDEELLHILQDAWGDMKRDADRPKPVSRQPTPSRNAPCPCGSGKKFKRCCG